MSYWEDVKEGYIFKDNSECLKRFETTKCKTYTLFLFLPKKGNSYPFVASEDHYLLCDIKRCSKAIKKSIESLVKHSYIPKIIDLHVSLENQYEETVATETRSLINGRNTYVWLSMREIHILIQHGERIRLVTNLEKNKKTRPITSVYSGEKDCFCIATDTGRYEVCGLINHNSVALRNVVFHALTHSNDIKLALIDLKRSEFEYLKGTNGVVGVGNTPREAVEILRLARDIMYKRNEENAKRGLTNFTDWQPKEATNKVKIFNTEFDENTSFEVEVAGEKKKMTAKEILDFMGR